MHLTGGRRAERQGGRGGSADIAEADAGERIDDRQAGTQRGVVREGQRTAADDRDAVARLDGAVDGRRGAEIDGTSVDGQPAGRDHDLPRPGRGQADRGAVVDDRASGIRIAERASDRGGEGRGGVRRHGDGPTVGGNRRDGRARRNRGAEQRLADEQVRIGGGKREGIRAGSMHGTGDVVGARVTEIQEPGGGGRSRAELKGRAIGDGRDGRVEGGATEHSGDLLADEHARRAAQGDGSSSGRSDDRLRGRATVGQSEGAGTREDHPLSRAGQTRVDRERVLVIVEEQLRGRGGETSEVRSLPKITGEIAGTQEAAGGKRQSVGERPVSQGVPRRTDRHIEGIQRGVSGDVGIEVTGGLDVAGGGAGKVAGRGAGHSVICETGGRITHDAEAERSGRRRSSEIGQEIDAVEDRPSAEDAVGQRRVRGERELGRLAARSGNTASDLTVGGSDIEHRSGVGDPRQGRCREVEAAADAGLRGES